MTSNLSWKAVLKEAMSLQRRKRTNRKICLADFAYSIQKANRRHCNSCILRPYMSHYSSAPESNKQNQASRSLDLFLNHSLYTNLLWVATLRMHKAIVSLDSLFQDKFCDFVWITGWENFSLLQMLFALNPWVNHKQLILLCYKPALILLSPSIMCRTTIHLILIVPLLVLSRIWSLDRILRENEKY